MKLEDAETVGRLAREVRDLDNELNWLSEQEEAGPLGETNRIARGAMMELGPFPSLDAAREVRAILKRDYLATRKNVAEQLNGLGVEIDEFPLNSHKPTTSVRA